MSRNNNNYNIRGKCIQTFKPIRVGFIGARKRAQGEHFPIVSKLEDVTIASVAEMDESRMAEVAEKYSYR